MKCGKLLWLRNCRFIGVNWTTTFTILWKVWERLWRTMYCNSERYSLYGVQYLKHDTTWTEQQPRVLLWLQTMMRRLAPSTCSDGATTEHCTAYCTTSNGNKANWPLYALGYKLTWGMQQSNDVLRHLAALLNTHTHISQWRPMLQVLRGTHIHFMQYCVAIRCIPDACLSWSNNSACHTMGHFTANMH